MVCGVIKMPHYEASALEALGAYYFACFWVISWFGLATICGIKCLIDKIRGKNDKNDTTNDT